MNVPTMTMPRYDAKAAVEEYETAIRNGRAVPGDQELLDGYKALARGKTIIDVVECFRATGLDANGRPKLAICRADAKTCHLRISSENAFFQANDSWVPECYKRFYVKIPRRAFLGSPGSVAVDQYNLPKIADGQAIVPSIPPRVRPSGSLKPYHILWEAVWQKNPPRDPFLLRELRFPLYIVVAHWDLAPLEMSILRTMRVTP